MTLEELSQAAKQSDLTAGQLGELADIYHGVRNRRLAADKVAASLKEQEVLAETLLIQQMIKQNITAAGGQTLRVSLAGPDYVPHIKDWPAFYQYIQKTGSFDLLERRPGKAACRDRWEAGEQVPGVEHFPVYKLSRNEVK